MEQLSERALQRRVKRHLLKEDQAYFAVTVPGFEDVLLAELSAFPGVTINSVTKGGIEFNGPIGLMYALNLRMRTLSKLLLRIQQVYAASSPALFNEARRIRWEEYIGFNDSVSLRISTRKSALNHPQKIRKILHDAIMARMATHGLSPEVLERDGRVKLVARLVGDWCALSMDLTGDPLHRRGYRTQPGAAPIRESIAAAILQFLDVTAYDVIVDPFCGSGTFLLEAHMMLDGTPPGFYRVFAFEDAPFFNREKWNGTKRRAAIPGTPFARKRLFGVDIEPDAIKAAETNAARLQAKDITFINGDAFEIPLSNFSKRSDSCLLVSNLPYGMRILNSKTSNDVFRRLCVKLRDEGKGWKVGLVVPQSWDTTMLPLSNASVRYFTSGGVPVQMVSGVVAQ